MSGAVAVAAVLKTNLQDVHAAAQEAFARDLDAYRAGVRAMADAGGTLPADKADELLGVCQRLGINHERLASDATAFIRLRNINARIDEIQARNAARREPLPELQREMEEAEREFMRVRVECMGKIQAAETAANVARRAYESIANIREERIEREQAETLDVHNQFPHLFQNITPDELRQFLARR